MTRTLTSRDLWAVALLVAGLGLAVATIARGWGWTAWTTALLLLALGTGLLARRIVVSASKGTPRWRPLVAGLAAAALVMTVGVTAASGLSWREDPLRAAGLPLGVRGDAHLFTSDTLDGGAIRALNPSGEEMWRVDGQTVGLFGDDLLMTDSGDDVQNLTVVDARTGDERWSTTVPERFTVVTVSDDTVLGVDGESRVQALDRADGSERWSRRTTPFVVRHLGEPHVLRNPTTGPVILSIETTSSITDDPTEGVQILDVRTGQTRRADLGSDDFDDVFVTDTGVVATTSDPEGDHSYVTVIDPATGERKGPPADDTGIWSREYAGGWYGELVASSQERAIMEVNLDEGTRLVAVSAEDGTAEEIPLPEGWEIDALDRHQLSDDPWVALRRDEGGDDEDGDDEGTRRAVWRPGMAEVVEIDLSESPEDDFGITTNVDGWVEVDGQTRSFIGESRPVELVIEPDGTVHETPGD